MKIRCFPVAVLTTAAFTLWSGFPALLTAQESAPAATPPMATEKVQLSSGAEEVLKLSRAKINDDITVAYVQNANRRFNLTANEIVYLRQAGVSDRVLTAMLSPQAPVIAEPATPPPATSSSIETSLASAPQYITSPASTTFVEPALSYPVYLATTPAYYSFYDPWPYWSSWYPYPAFAFGFYWGWGGYSCGWNNCYNGYWNNYCHYGNPPPPNGNPPPPNGNRPPPPNGNGNPPSPNGRTGGQPGTFASDGRQLRAANPTAASSAPSRSESRFDGTASSARPTSTWANNANQSASMRTSASQANATAGSQVARPILENSGANTRTTAGRATSNPGGDPHARANYNSSPTSVWTANTRQEAASRTTANQNAATFARPSRASTSPTTTWSRPSNPATPRYSASHSVSYQRGSPSYNYRPSNGAASFGRSSSPSFSRPSSPSFGGASSFQGGGSFSSPRPSGMSAGGGMRGGGGGRSR